MKKGVKDLTFQNERRYISALQFLAFEDRNRKVGFTCHLEKQNSGRHVHNHRGFVLDTPGKFVPKRLVMAARQSRHSEFVGIFVNKPRNAVFRSGS